MKTYIRNWFQSSKILNEHLLLATHQVWSWVISSDMKVLIVDDATKFNFPGGTVEKGETNIQTLERELFEEIGMDKKLFDGTEKYQFGYYIIEEFEEQKLIDKYLQVRYLLKLGNESHKYNFHPKEIGDLAVVDCKFVEFQDLSNYFHWIENSGEFKYIKSEFII